MVAVRSVFPHRSSPVANRPDALQDAIQPFLGRLRDLGVGWAVLASYRLGPDFISRNSWPEAPLSVQSPSGASCGQSAIPTLPTTGLEQSRKRQGVPAAFGRRLR